MVRALEAARRAARRAQEATYEGICTIIGYQDVTDEKTGISSETEVVVAKDQPCKLSFERLDAAAHLTVNQGGKGVDSRTPCKVGDNKIV